MKMTGLHWQQLQHFAPHEFVFPAEMDVELMVRLDYAREMFGGPFVITSSFRPGDPKSHGKGYAVDISCVDSAQRFNMVEACKRAGFCRIGVYDRHIHVDVWHKHDAQIPSPVMWVGQSE